MPAVDTIDSVDHVGLNNGAIEIRFMKSSGQLCVLKNLRTGTDYVKRRTQEGIHSDFTWTADLILSFELAPMIMAFQEALWSLPCAEQMT